MSDDATTTDIPEARYSFALLKRAQAVGDDQTLEAHERRAVRIHLEAAATIGELATVFAEALR